MASNYPPGVSGNEIQIVGPEEFVSDFQCPKCRTYEEEQLFFIFPDTIETECCVCGVANIEELELYTE